MNKSFFFSALCYSLVMASCGGGATEKHPMNLQRYSPYSRTVFRHLLTA